jgi:hypothetical protein
VIHFPATALIMPPPALTPTATGCPMMDFTPPMFRRRKASARKTLCDSKIRQVPGPAETA